MEKLLNEEQQGKLLSLIENAQHIVVCGHVGPDGDAVGSALAIKHWLSRLGKQVQVVMPNRFPDFLRWMPGAGEIHVFLNHEAAVSAIVKEADLFIIEDLNDPSRLSGLMEPVMANPAPKVMIDHHLHPSDFCQMVVSRPEMCATGEVLCHLFSQLGEMNRLTRDEATCLYAAMMCDTGAFTYGSGRPVVYECISLLLRRGIDKDRIYRNVFWTWSPARLKLVGYMLYVKLEIMPGLHASLLTLTNEERRMFSIKNGDTEGIVNMPLQVAGMRLSIFLNEDTEHPGLVKVSLRSVDNFPCDEMAARFFSGGGHRNASGGKLYMTMEEAVVKVREAVKCYEDMLK